jgi:hypothetical protein
MCRHLMILVAVASLAGTAHAQSTFTCGDATVQIEVVERDSEVRELRAEPVLTVTLHGRETILRYWGSIDFIGGVCMRDSRDRPMVVYQAYCGGTGCYDRDNWGVVDAQSLRVTLVPDNSNRGRAMELLGKELPEISDMVSVRAAAERHEAAQR